MAGPVQGRPTGLVPGEVTTPSQAQPQERTAGDIQIGRGRIGEMDAVLGADEGVQVEQQPANDAPGNGGRARGFLQRVTAFFGRVIDRLNAVGQGAGQAAIRLFDRVEREIDRAATQLDALFTRRAGGNQPPQAQAPAPQPGAAPADPQAAMLEREKNLALKEGIQDLGDKLAEDYQSYQEQNGEISIEDFVALRLPAPEGELDPESHMNIGDRLESAAGQVEDGNSEIATQMRKAVTARFEELPSLSIAMDYAFSDEMSSLEGGQTTTFLRANSAYTKLEKLFSRESVPLTEVNTSLLNAASEALAGSDPDGIVDGRAIQRNEMTTEQRVAVEAAGDQILNDLLDISEETEGSYLNSIPQEFRDHLSDKAEQILAKENVPIETRRTAVKNLYMNTLFLRGQTSSFSSQNILNQNASRGEKAIIGAANKEILCMLNDIEVSASGGTQSNAALAHFHEGQSNRVDAFLTAVGMPDLAEGL